MITDTVIEITDASFGYQKNKALFTQINLSIGQGEVFCLFGPNGCGKTTLLDCIMNINKIFTGSIKVLGKNINTYKRAELAQIVAYVPQIHNRTFPYTVKEVVMMGRAAYIGAFAAPNEEDEQIALESIALVGMEQFVDTPYTQLSGGEVQLVMLARALGQKTKIIIMDEPTAHLDFKNELLLLETIVKLSEISHVAIVMATHEPNHAFYFQAHNLDTKVALMHQGVIDGVGEPDQILTAKQLNQVYGIQAQVFSFLNEQGREQKSMSLIKTLHKEEPISES